MVLDFVRKIYGVLGRFASFGPLLGRLLVGLIFVEAGWGKLHNLEHVIGFFKSLGIPAAEIQAPMVASFELVFGALVLIGLLTRLAVLPLLGIMTVALLTAYKGDITGVSSLLPVVDFHYLIILVWLAVSGAGRFSVDHFILKKQG